MQQILTQLKHKYQTGTVVEKLIFINILVFILTYFIGGIGALYNSSQNFIYYWFSLPANIYSFFNKPWTILTYGFLHAGFPHLLFNLITLYYIGNLFIDYFIPKKLLTFYLMGTILGGCIYLVSYSYFPALQLKNPTLVGASAGIMAIVIGLTTHIPNYELKFRFIGYVKLLYIGLIFIAWDLINLGSNNTGGHIAHFGGALYGFLAVYYKDSFKIKPKKRTPKSPLKTSYKATQKKESPTNSKTTQQQIDAILDKISKSGYDSLSKTEKDFLFQQGKK